MKRKTSEIPTRVWVYGCKLPSRNADLFAKHQRAQRRYYNQLIEIETERRIIYRALRKEHYSELAAIESKLDALNAEIEQQDSGATADQKKRRKDLSARSKPLRERAKEDMAAPVAELNDRLGESRTNERKRLKVEAVAAMLEEDWSEFWKDVATLNQAMLVKTEAASAASGLFHGSYSATSDAAKQAWKAHDKLIKDPKADPVARAKAIQRGHPRFRNATAGSKIGVQVQGGYALPESGPFEVHHANLEIDPIPEGQWETRSGRKHAYTRVRIRAGSVRPRKGPFGCERRREVPIWFEFPVVIHRRPQGAIRWAYIVTKRVGTRTRYELQLTLESSKFVKPNTGSGAVAVHFGHRALPDGRLRVGYMVDDSGNEEEITLTPKQRQRLERPEKLRSLEDLYFERVRSELVEWMLDHPALVTDELRAATQHITKWRAVKKLARAAGVLVAQEFPTSSSRWHWWGKWKGSRMGTGQDLLAPREHVYHWLREHGVHDEAKLMALYLDFWRIKNRHLYEWESNERASAMRDRLEVYRLVAAKACATYATVLIDDRDLSETAKRPPPGKERSRQQKHADHNRFIASCSELKVAFMNAASPGQTNEATGETHRCSRCGRTDAADMARTIVVSCPCGWAEDQDARYCRHMLAQFERKAA